MTILQIHNYYQKTGGEDFVIKAEKQLLEQYGHNVIQLTANNDNIKLIIKKRSQFYLELKSILRSTKIDVVHIHNTFHTIGSNIYKKLFSYKIPIIQTLHNYRFLCPNGLFLDNNNKICELCSSGNFRHSVLKKCYQHSFIKSFLIQNSVKLSKKIAQKYVSKYIVLTQFSKTKYNIAGFNEKQLVIKSNFITETKKTTAVEYQPYALFIGRLSIEKGIDVLIKAFAQIKFTLKIAGNGDYFDILRQQAKDSSNIEFYGHVAGDKKKQLFRNAAFIISSSICYEGFPISILEANSYKKSVIASNLGGIPEIIKDGYNGFLFEAGNANSLKYKIRKIINNKLYIKLGQNAYNSFIEKYTAQTNYQQLIEIYNQAINDIK